MVAMMQIDFGHLHLLSVHGWYREFKVATLAQTSCVDVEFLTGQSLLPSSLLECLSFLRCISFMIIQPYSPGAQEWASHAGLCHTVLVLLIILGSLLAHCCFNIIIIVQEIDRMNEENSRLQERLKQIESQVCHYF